MKKIIWCICLMCMICSSCSHKSKRISQEPLEPLTIGMMSSTEGLPFLVAADKGIYDSLGLHVDFKIYQSVSDRESNFESHHIDGMLTDYPNAAVLQSKGFPLRSIMQNDGYLCLLTHAASKINSVSHLKNINFCSSRNSFSQYAANYVLYHAHIADGLVNQPEVNQLPLRMVMLEDRQIDATFLPEPYATFAMSNGCHSIITTENLKINQYTTVFTRNALKEKSASVKALLEGYNLAVDYIVSHPRKDWANALTNDLKIPANYVGLIVLPNFTHAKRPNMFEITRCVAWLKKKKAVKNDYTGTELVDSSYIEKDIAPVRVKIRNFRKLLLNHGRKHT